MGLVPVKDHRNQRHPVSFGAGNKGVACQGRITCLACKGTRIVDGFILVKHLVVVGHVSAFRRPLGG